jgi:hypothetical protein
MSSKRGLQPIIPFLLAALVAGCACPYEGTSISASMSIPPTRSIAPTSVIPQPSRAFDASRYAFPNSVNPAGSYLFYLHGKIIEDQGIPAVSPDYGEYEYQAILEKLASHGLIVISEARARETDSMEYAQRITAQVTALLESGVPAGNITVVGASKGAGITILASHLLGNRDLNFVIMAICNPATLDELEHDGITLNGNVLSIYDSSDTLTGTCQRLFSFSEGKGISKHEEIVLKTGTGHGMTFRSLDAWMLPALQWAGAQ